MTTPPPPKPCPRCYTPMRKTASGYECAKHGTPAPDRPVEPRLTRPPKPRVQREPRPKKPREPFRRWGKEVRYPSDLKLYPLPPSPDGRANDRTSVESPTTARSRLTPALLARAVEMAERGMTPWQIAGEIWEQAGYTSRESCKGSLYRALRNAKVLT